MTKFLHEKHFHGGQPKLVPTRIGCVFHIHEMRKLGSPNQLQISILCTHGSMEILQYLSRTCVLFVKLEAAQMKQVQT